MSDQILQAISSIAGQVENVSQRTAEYISASDKLVDLVTRLLDQNEKLIERLTKAEQRVVELESALREPEIPEVVYACDDAGLTDFSLIIMSKTRPFSSEAGVPLVTVSAGTFRRLYKAINGDYDYADAWK